MKRETTGWARRLQPEVMDQPGLDPVEHRRALDGLRRINSWSGTVAALWPTIRSHVRRLGERPVRLLDLACGGGDVTVGLWRRAKAEGVALEVAGCDRSEVAIAVARELAPQAVRFFMHDAIADVAPRDYDILLSTLFLHHLDEGEALAFLGRMAESGAGLLMVDDLCRGPFGWGLAWFGSRVLSQSPVVHVDALRSVEGSFTAGEAVELARRAGWAEVTVRAHWPARFLMTGGPR